MFEESVYLFFFNYGDNVIHIYFPPRGRYGALKALDYFFKVFHVNDGNEWRYRGIHGRSLELLVEFSQEGEDSCSVVVPKER